MSKHKNAASSVEPPAAAPEPAYSWLPISSAPRDGSNILIRFGQDGVSQAKYVPGTPHPWKFIDTNDGITWLVNHAVDGPGGPSHWMPIPSHHSPEPGKPAPSPVEAVAWAVYNGWSRICVYMTEDNARAHAQKAQKNHDLFGSLAAFRVVPLYAASANETAAKGTKDEAAIRKTMTSEQIQLERKLTCEAIDGAMALGYQNTNPPPSADHWLAPFWKIGRKQYAAEFALRYLDDQLTEYLEGMPADETSRKLRDVARNAMADIEAAPSLPAMAAEAVAIPAAWLKLAESARSLRGLYHNTNCNPEGFRLSVEALASEAAKLLAAPQPAQADAQDQVADARECGEPSHPLSDFERTVLEYIAFNEGFDPTRFRAQAMLDGIEPPA